jgi:PIN domain nuclease of toxin-antitoxin system
MLDDSPRLGPQARQAITSAQGVHVSAATVWELTIKSMLGKLTVPHDLSRKLPGQGVEPNVGPGHDQLDRLRVRKG